VLYLLTFSATSILAQKDKGERAKLITDFIYIADELYKLNNFSSTSVNFMPAGILGSIAVPSFWNLLTIKYFKNGKSAVFTIQPILFYMTFLYSG